MGKKLQRWGINIDDDQLRTRENCCLQTSGSDKSTVAAVRARSYLSSDIYTKRSKNFLEESICSRRVWLQRIQDVWVFLSLSTKFPPKVVMQKPTTVRFYFSSSIFLDWLGNKGAVNSSLNQKGVKSKWQKVAKRLWIKEELQSFLNIDISNESEP